MKKVLIGGILLFTGSLISLAIILAAALYVPSITAWSGSKLWYAIFGAEQYENEVVQSLSLGFPFIVGVILFVIGLIVLVNEYFIKD
ncbi:hypothetical protein [Paenibacillus sp. W2I17]|uniref:hypothetical protein n=1 Tax=Paenibacillus sp. W2I17 TaxID=3042311 RepID=UPI002787A45C|nr:hypothetical protein [Paenibacillus sp. W2I17]MDQ0656032.1 uncharacterized membrane protein YgdD (TMEM256/DUF423 family) [Paenibacillus sp. W2I17]